MNNIPEHLLATYMNVFCNRRDTWFRQRHNSSQYVYIEPNMKSDEFEYMPVDIKLLKLICLGKITASWPATDVDGYTKWIAHDSDSVDGQLDILQCFYEKHGWSIIRTKGRPDRDGHLFLCFDRPIVAEDAMLFADSMARYAGVKGIERFPKYKPPSISQLRGPLGINRKLEANNSRDWIVGAPQDVIEQLNYLSQQPLNAAVRFEATVKILKLRQAPKPVPQQSKIFAGKNKCESVMFDFAIAKTSAKRGSNGWWNAHCPLSVSHKCGDEHKSFGLREGDYGQAIPKCFAGCSPKDIYQALRQ